LIAKMLFVLSAKGGVGKSTIASSLAVWLRKIYSVGLVDCDPTNPSVPHIMDIDGTFQPRPDRLRPVVKDGVKVASVTFALPGCGLPIIWSGETSKHFVFHLFKSIDWGGVDVLVLDTPPGVHDETLWLLRAFGRGGGAVVVTTPQGLSVENVRRTISMCRDKEIRVVGLIENMASFKCPECGRETPLGSGDAELMAAEEEIPYCGRVPYSPEVEGGGDLTPILESGAFKRLSTYVMAWMKEG